VSVPEPAQTTPDRRGGGHWDRMAPSRSERAPHGSDNLICMCKERLHWERAR